MMTNGTSGNVVRYACPTTGANHDFVPFWDGGILARQAIEDEGQDTASTHERQLHGRIYANSALKGNVASGAVGNNVSAVLVHERDVERLGTR